MRSYIIHMTGDLNRQANAKALLSALPGARIADAVVGRDALASGTPKPRPGTLFRPRYPFPLSAGEVGCFLSHRTCWQRIVKDNLEYALIAEDDLSLDPAIWPDVLELIRRNATPDSFIRIPAKHRERPRRLIDRSGSAQLFAPHVPGLQTVCQVVGRSAAQRLLDKSETLDRPVDTYLQMHWITGQPMLSIHPNGVSELTADLGGSTIQGTSNGKAEREVRRAWYRAQVAMRPQTNLTRHLRSKLTP